MAPGRDLGGLDDVQVLGAWNFTLQADTPLYWLRCGKLDRYLLKFKVEHPSPSTWGLVLHAEADMGGSDGTSFWVERKPAGKYGEPATKRYLLSGEGLESRPIVTRSYPDDCNDQEEEVEVLMQGFSGAVMVQNRKVQLNFKTKKDRGCVAFYNSTQAERDDVHFSDVRITALRRGPMEIGGNLGQREQNLRANEAEQTKTQGFRATVPGTERQQVSSSRQLGSTWSDGSGSGTGKGGQRGLLNRGQQGSGVLRSASEGVLRKSTGALGASGTRGASNSKGQRWMAVATNAPASEKQLIKDSMRPQKLSSNSCSDFIPGEKVGH